jgi:hypothetical protein
VLPLPGNAVSPYFSYSFTQRYRLFGFTESCCATLRYWQFIIEHELHSCDLKLLVELLPGHEPSLFSLNFMSILSYPSRIKRIIGPKSRGALQLIKAISKLIMKNLFKFKIR